MKITSRNIKLISAAILLTTFLTWFFYVHEKLPNPLRAATALIETPVALASALFYYLKLGLPVYETPWAILLANFISSLIIVFLADKLLNKRRKHNTNKNNLKL